tara:strand:- start:521 stop:1195 length:675 start_codon:yes stop_codon:yes gene_type:complete
MIAYIPARLGSERIKQKNIIKLNGKPLIIHVIENLKKLKFISQVCVSTESSKIANLIKGYDVTILNPRKISLADNKTNFMDLIKKDVGRFLLNDAKDNEVLFVLPTAVLITSQIFKDAYKKYKKNKPDVLMSCNNCNPFFSLIIKNKKWKPLFKNKINSNTQDLPKSIIDAGSFYFFNYDNIRKFSSLKNVNYLEPYILPRNNSVDLDDLSDFDDLKFKFKMNN